VREIRESLESSTDVFSAGTRNFQTTVI